MSDEQNVHCQIELTKRYLVNELKGEAYGPDLIKFARQINALQRIQYWIPRLEPEPNPPYKSGYEVTYVKPKAFHMIAKYLYEMNGYEYPYLDEKDARQGACYFYGDNMGIQVTHDPSEYISLAVYAMPKELQELNFNGNSD